MSKKWSGYVRVKPVTQIAINLIAGEIKQRSGKNASANQALWRLIAETRPDIAERARQIAEEEGVLESDAQEQDD